MRTLEHLADDQLSARLVELRADERNLIVQFLLHLAELERRRLHLALGHSSLFAYCTDRLRLTKGATFRRVTAARLLARFPIIESYLADGRLCLTTLIELRDVLEEDNHLHILDLAAWQPEDRVRDLVASLRPPAPASANIVSRVPVPIILRAGSVVPYHREALAELAETVQVEEIIQAAERASVDADGGPRTSSDAGPARRMVGEPIYRMGLTVGREFKETLDEVKDLLSHKFPDGNLEQVLLECLRVTRESCLKRRRGSGKGKGKKGRRSGGTGRHIPVEVRQQVWVRDEGKCTFVGTDGKRCASTHRVQYHHIEPYGRGGRATVDNITLYCAAHNRYRAELDYGEAHMARYRGS